MLAIHTPTSIGWTPGPASQGTSPQPVSGTAAVRKVAPDPQPGGGRDRSPSLPMPDRRQAAADREAPAAPGLAASEADTAAPLLPRPRSPEQERQARVDEAREAEADGEETTQAQDTEAEQRVPPQELLSSVWQASAGVVEQVLADGVADTGAARAAPVDGTSEREAAEREVVSYDETGHGNPAPVELGTILSERV